MASRSPLVTLAVGAALAAVLYGLSANAASPEPAAAAPAPPAASDTASASPSASATQPAEFAATYVGHVEGGGASVAVVIKDGKAAAYVCDGRRIEQWLQGSAEGGRLELSGVKGGASLTGGYGAGGASGEVVVDGREWSFDVATVRKPGGLYRASRQMRQGIAVAGWIVQADGSQVGIVTVDGEPRPAPELDPSSVTAELDGEPLQPEPVEGPITP